MPDSPDLVTRPIAPGSTGTPGTPPADSPKLAAEREAQLAATAADTVATRGLSSEQLMPTCMIVTMFGVLAAFICPIILWVLNSGLPQLLNNIGR